VNKGYKNGTKNGFIAGLIGGLMLGIFIYLKYNMIPYTGNMHISSLLDAFEILFLAFLFSFLATVGGLVGSLIKTLANKINLTNE